MCCECSDWLLRKERHKSHLMVLFIHEEAREVIADTFFSCHFYAIMGFSCWYQLRRRALNNRYQLKQNAQLNVISISGRRRETLIMIIKMFKIISADERGVGFWCLVNGAKRKSVIGPKTNHLPKHVSEIMSPMLPHCRWWGMKKDELEHLMFLRFVSHQIKDNERIFQNIFRILTQFPLSRSLNLIIFFTGSTLNSLQTSHFNPPQNVVSLPCLSCYRAVLSNSKFKHHHEMCTESIILVVVIE